MSYDNKMRNGRAFGFTDSLVAAASLVVNENEADRKDRIAKSKEPEQLDEVSKEKLAAYSAKASDARGHRKLSTKKVDNRYAGVAKASKKMDEEKDSDNPPFEGGKKVTGPSKDKFGNVIKNKAKHLAKQAMKDQQKEEVEPAETTNESWDDEQFLDWIAESTEEDWDFYLDSLTDDELAELEEGILSAVGRGIKSVAKKAVFNSKGEGRLSTAGRATSAERKTKNLQDKTAKIQKKTDTKNRLAKAKSAQSLAKQKLQAVKQKARETDSSKPQIESKQLDPVGQEDDDLNNNGVDNDKSDRYLKKRRATIKKAIRKDVEEAAPMPTAKQQSGVDRIKAAIARKNEIDNDRYSHHRQGDKKKAANESMSVHVKQDDKGTGYTVTKVGSKMKKHGGIKVGEKMSDTHIDDAGDSGIKVHHEAVNEDMGDEKVRSSSQSAELAKHYYAKAKQAQQQGDTVAAAKMMSAAKSFYRKSEGMQGKEKAGTPTGQSEELGVAITYWNEAEVEEIEAADDIAEVRVTKAAKSEPEHIGMQMRKVISLGSKHQGVEFHNGGTEKVSSKTAHAAMGRYNSAKPGEKEELQKHMAHSHDALKHVASGKPLSDSPAAEKKGRGIDISQEKRHGVTSKSGHYN